MPKVQEAELPLDISHEPPPPPAMNADGTPKQMLDIRALKEMNIGELTQVAKDLGVEGAAGLRK